MNAGWWKRIITEKNRINKFASQEANKKKIFSLERYVTRGREEIFKQMATMLVRL